MLYDLKELKKKYRTKIIFKMKENFSGTSVLVSASPSELGVSHAVLLANTVAREKRGQKVC